METITFHEPKNNITFTIKSEFANVCPDFKNLFCADLIEKYNIFNFFHNPNGPAVVDHKENIVMYFLDGQMVEGEALEKIKHREQFNGKMDVILKEEAVG